MALSAVSGVEERGKGRWVISQAVETVSEVLSVSEGISECVSQWVTERLIYRDAMHLKRRANRVQSEEWGQLKRWGAYKNYYSSGDKDNLELPTNKGVMRMETRDEMVT